MGSVRKILVVDDNIDAANMTAEILQFLGLDVRVAYGGAEALTLAVATTPDVIFLDIGMPGMDGYDVARALRGPNGLAHVKIVALTAWDDVAVREKAKAAGFDIHVTKPAQISQLVDIAMLGR